MKPLLLADCVGKSYGDRRVLSSATLRAVPGELRVIFGRNGCGKSTLLKIAVGWLAPDTGVVHVDGRAHLRIRLHALAAAGVFYLPDHEVLADSFTLREQLEMFRRRFGGMDPEEAAATMGVAQGLDRRPSQLSGGEIRRAELAAVFARRPRCLVADEPYRGIAPKDAEDLTAAFRRLASSGVAVVVTGHEAPTLLAAADHVTWCVAGTTHELGLPAEAQNHEGFQRDYLGGVRM